MTKVYALKVVVSWVEERSYLGDVWIEIIDSLAKKGFMVKGFLEDELGSLLEVWFGFHYVRLNKFYRAIKWVGIKIGEQSELL